jgi:antitoxin PrlF
MATSTITSKGQTTIPADIRAFLKVGAGDKIQFVRQPDGKVFLVPLTYDIEDLYGILPKLKKTLSVEDMDKIVQKRLAKKFKK